MGGMENRHYDILNNFYKISMISAKKLGYRTILYTNPDKTEIFKEYADEIITAENYEDSPLFDSFKIKVLEERNDDFYLIDGDVILSSRLPEFDADVTFDAYETRYWKTTYGDPIKELLSLGISEEMPIFNKTKAQKIFNCGLLRITNPDVAIKYISMWKEFNYFIKNNILKLKLEQTAVGAQYILTLISNDMGAKCIPISEFLGDQNKYYRHYAGKLKYTIKDNITETKKMF
jgi:hypothetical protein